MKTATLYVFVGAVGFVLLINFIFGFLRLGPFPYLSPFNQFVAGGLLGWIIWRLRANRPPKA